MKLYRASTDDYVFQGITFAEDRESAEAYLDNPGFGGPVLYAAELPDSHLILDLTEDPWETLSDVLGHEITPDMGAGLISQALQSQPGILDGITAEGYDWVRYLDDYPAGCVSYTVCSDRAESDIEDAMEEI